MISRKWYKDALDGLLPPVVFSVFIIGTICSLYFGGTTLTITLFGLSSIAGVLLIMCLGPD